MLPLYAMIIGAVLIVLGFAIAVLRNDRDTSHTHHKP